MALVLTGVAFLSFSCRSKHEFAEIDKETLKTQESENLTMINSVNGELNYRFETPLLERYELASEPYMEFRRGIKVETYNDSTGRVESELVADYAKYIEPLDLWEARGNVVGKNFEQDQVLETEQLFWDQKTDKIYSNVLTKITQGEDVIVGTGFESNSKFDNYIFRRPRGQVSVDTEPNSAPADSLGTTDSLSVGTVPDHPEAPTVQDLPSADLPSVPEADAAVLPEPFGEPAPAELIPVPAEPRPLEIDTDAPRPIPLEMP